MRRLKITLEQLERCGLERHVLDTLPIGGGRVLVKGRELVDFCSNDYLGLSEHPAVIEASCAATRRLGAGAKAARLLSGSRVEASEIERRVAQLTGKEAALLFNSGYHANVGMLPVIAGPGDVVLSDRYNHASLIDGIRLSGAQVKIFEHGDIEELEKLVRADSPALEESPPVPADVTLPSGGEAQPRVGRSTVVVTEGVFSMGGDIPEASLLVELKKKHGLLLYVDDAHGFGVLGKKGLGAFEDQLAAVDVLVITLGKAVGMCGAVVAASGELIRLATSRARSFMFSTALPPGVLGGVLASLDIIFSEEGQRRRARVLDLSTRFRLELQKAGWDCGASSTHIVPVVVGDEQRAADLSHRLFEAGIFCRAIRYPAVPRGAACLRFSLTSQHQVEDVLRAVEALGNGPGSNGGTQATQAQGNRLC